MTYVYRWVRSGMAPLYEEKKVQRQVGVRKVQVRQRKGFLGKEVEVVEIDEPIYEEVTEKVPTGKYSQTYIDMDAYAKAITEQCNDLHEQGYDVIKITEVIEGKYNWDKYGTSAVGNGGAPTCYSYGYSVTDGVVIIGKKREAVAPK